MAVLIESLISAMERLLHKAETSADSEFSVRVHAHVRPWLRFVLKYRGQLQLHAYEKDGYLCIGLRPTGTVAMPGWPARAGQPLINSSRCLQLVRHVLPNVATLRELEQDSLSRMWSKSMWIYVLHICPAAPISAAPRVGYPDYPGQPACFLSRVISGNLKKPPRQPRLHGPWWFHQQMMIFLAGAGGDGADTLSASALSSMATGAAADDVEDDPADEPTDMGDNVGAPTRPLVGLPARTLRAVNLHCGHTDVRKANQAERCGLCGCARVEVCLSCGAGCVACASLSLASNPALDAHMAQSTGAAPEPPAVGGDPRDGDGSGDDVLTVAADSEADTRSESVAEVAEAAATPPVAMDKDPDDAPLTPAAASVASAAAVGSAPTPSYARSPSPRELPVVTGTDTPRRASPPPVAPHPMGSPLISVTALRTELKVGAKRRCARKAWLSPTALELPPTHLAVLETDALLRALSEPVAAVWTGLREKASAGLLCWMSSDWEKFRRQQVLLSATEPARGVDEEWADYVLGEGRRERLAAAWLNGPTCLKKQLVELKTTDYLSDDLYLFGGGQALALPWAIPVPTTWPSAQSNVPVADVVLQLRMHIPPTAPVPWRPVTMFTPFYLAEDSHFVGLAVRWIDARDGPTCVVSDHLGTNDARFKRLLANWAEITRRLRLMGEAMLRQWLGATAAEYLGTLPWALVVDWGPQQSPNECLLRVMTMPFRLVPYVKADDPMTIVAEKGALRPALAAIVHPEPAAAAGAQPAVAPQRVPKRPSGKTQAAQPAPFIDHPAAHVGATVPPPLPVVSETYPHLRLCPWIDLLGRFVGFDVELTKPVVRGETVCAVRGANGPIFVQANRLNHPWAWRLQRATKGLDTPGRTSGVREVQVLEPHTSEIGRFLNEALDRADLQPRQVKKAIHFEALRDITEVPCRVRTTYVGGNTASPAYDRLWPPRAQGTSRRYLKGVRVTFALLRTFVFSRYGEKLIEMGRRLQTVTDDELIPFIFEYFDHEYTKIERTIRASQREKQQRADHVDLSSSDTESADVTEAASASGSESATSSSSSTTGVAGQPARRRKTAGATKKPRRAPRRTRSGRAARARTPTDIPITYGNWNAPKAQFQPAVETVGVSYGVHFLPQYHGSFCTHRAYRQVASPSVAVVARLACFMYVWGFDVREIIAEHHWALTGPRGDVTRRICNPNFERKLRPLATKFALRPGQGTVFRNCGAIFFFGHYDDRITYDEPLADVCWSAEYDRMMPSIALRDVRQTPRPQPAKGSTKKPAAGSASAPASGKSTPRVHFADDKETVPELRSTISKLEAELALVRSTLSQRDATIITLERINADLTVESAGGRRATKELEVAVSRVAALEAELSVERAQVESLAGDLRAAKKERKRAVAAAVREAEASAEKKLQDAVKDAKRDAELECNRKIIGYLEQIRELQAAEAASRKSM